MPPVFFEVDFTFKYPNFSRDPIIYNSSFPHGNLKQT